MSTSLDPLDLTGGQFLTLYLALLLCAGLASVVVPDRLRPSGVRRDTDDPEDLAVLIGGTTRLAEVIVTKLLTQDALTLTKQGRYARGGAAASAATLTGRTVLAAMPCSSWTTLEDCVRPHVATIERGLIDAGLVVDPECARHLRIAAAAPYCILLAFGMSKLMAGLLRARPIGYLAALLVATAGIALIRWFKADRKTHSGRDLVAQVRKRAARLRGAPMREEAGLAVALFGTTVLVGSGLASFHQARAASSDGGSGCGADGGGGGGCGGCSG